MIGHVSSLGCEQRSHLPLCECVGKVIDFFLCVCCGVQFFVKVFRGV